MAVDISIIGKKTKEYVIEIEKGHIRSFVEAIGDSSPLYYDEEYAKSTPFKAEGARRVRPRPISQAKGQKIAPPRGGVSIGLGIPFFGTLIFRFSGA